MVASCSLFLAGCVNLELVIYLFFIASIDAIIFFFYS